MPTLATRVVDALADLGLALKPHLAHLDQADAEQMLTDLDTLAAMIEGGGLVPVANLVARMARRCRLAAANEYAVADVDHLRSIETAAMRLRDALARHAARRRR